MATDTALIIQNLLRTADLGGRTVLSVGAGGGQLVDYARETKRVLAVDRDPAALEALRERLAARGLSERFELLLADFLEVERTADVVLFEFSLHEIPDPLGALRHAAALAPEIVVLDHAVGSAWAHCVDETEKVQASTRAMAAFSPAGTHTFRTEQRFRDHQELADRVRAQGAVALQRIEPFRGLSPVVIPMAYAITRFRGGGPAFPSGRSL